MAGAEHATVAAEAASFTRVGRSKRHNARCGDKYCERKIFGHGSPIRILQRHGQSLRPQRPISIANLLRIGHLADCQGGSSDQTYPTLPARLARIFPGCVRLRFDDTASNTRISSPTRKLFKTFCVKIQASLEPSRSNHHFGYIPESVSSEIDRDGHAVIGGFDRGRQLAAERFVVEIDMQVGENGTLGFDALDPLQRARDMGVTRVRRVT